MSRLLALALATALGAASTASGGCGGAEKVIKPLKKQKEPDAKALLADAREAAQTGLLLDADKAYGKSFALSNEFDTLEEHVDFLIVNGKPTRATEVSKGYYDANVASTRGYKLYAEALLAANRSAEALEVADQVIAANSGDPAGWEKRGRAYLQLRFSGSRILFRSEAISAADKKSLAPRQAGFIVSIRGFAAAGHAGAGSGAGAFTAEAQRTQRKRVRVKQ